MIFYGHEDENVLAHYGILRKSGRYPWGSGESPGQRGGDFIATVSGLRKEGLSDGDIARGFGMTTSDLRNATTIARNAKKAADINQAQRLQDHGYSNVQIGKKMGINESSVRALLAPGQKEKLDVLNATANMLKDEVASKKYLDIGAGTEHHMGISDTKLKSAVSRLTKEEDYTLHYVKVRQLGTGHETRMKILAAPGTPYSEVFANRHNIKGITNYSDDGGKSFTDILPPLSVSSKRVKVRYAEEGGADADGVIYVRRGVDDVTLGKNSYAQVRVAVDGSHYLKGMAIYKDDLPDGVDLMFNTNKTSTGNKLDAMKKMSDDPDNPFGAVVRQIKTPDGKRVTSAMNLVNEEGNWNKWSNTLSSQMLSKQSPNLARDQLNMAFERQQRELKQITELNNPAVRRKLLEAYADSADSAATHLKAAALPRQANKVILPVNTMKENEIYAPTFKNGERVALVRFPHGGTFEIPELTVNNRHPGAKKLLGNALDAVGIHSKVAERLSGADFDGDTVLVIPNNSGRVKSKPPLQALKGFDPKGEYPAYPGMKKMTELQKGIQMGLVSNLITDMTIRGASDDELARAVRHSMVVIDAEKHNLNYKQSAINNGIPQLMKKYQTRSTGGASTLISRAGSKMEVNERKQGYRVDPVTGKKIFTETGNSFVGRDGKTIVKKDKVKKLAETDDAHTLSSGTLIERVYADHSNRMKDLANQARKAGLQTKTTPYSTSARTAYAKEVASLNRKLTEALRNAPLERQAQVLANAMFAAKKAANPDMDKDQIKKIKFLALKTARSRVGAGKTQIEIDDSEWDAIQAGAISNHKLNQILSNADLDRVKQLATPKSAVTVSAGARARARSMAAQGYTQAEIAEALGVAVSTLQNVLSEEE